MSEDRVCPNCKERLTKEGHFAPPSVGEPGFYVCQRSEDYAGLVKRLREMAEHGGAPSRLATMRAAADVLEVLARERDELLERRLATAEYLLAREDDTETLKADVERLERERETRGAASTCG